MAGRRATAGEGTDACKETTQQGYEAVMQVGITSFG